MSNGFETRVHNKMTGIDELSSVQDPGMYVIDGRKLLMEKDGHPVKISDSTVGVNGFLKINYASSRLFFLQDFNTCLMVPEVHKNTFQFMNRPKPEEKVLTHIENGVFSMLTKNAYLQSWSMKSSKEITRKRKIDLPITEGVELKDFYLSKTGDEQQSYDDFSI